MKSMIISEIFHNIQGEGIFTGYPSYFLRTAGCSIKCAFCDTTYSWLKERKEGLSSGIYQEIEIDDVVNQIIESNLKHVVITGGEPAEQIEEVTELTKSEKIKDRIFTIETSGNINFDPSASNIHLISCSPKMEGMHARDKSPERYDHLSEMIKKQLSLSRFFQLKFVIGNKSDFDQSIELIQKLVQGDDCRKINLIFQPNNRNPSENPDTVQGLLQYVEMYKILMRMVMDFVKSSPFAKKYPQIRVLVQNHWIGHGRTKGI